MHTFVLKTVCRPMRYTLGGACEVRHTRAKFGRFANLANLS